MAARSASSRDQVRRVLQHGRVMPLGRSVLVTQQLPERTSIVGSVVAQISGSASAQRLPRLAARYADEYVITLPSPDQARVIRTRLDEACEKAGRDPASLRLAVFTPICVGATEQEAQARFAHLRETNPQYLRMMNAETAWIMGSPEQARAQLARLEEAGVARALLSVNCDLHREMLPLLT